MAVEETTKYMESFYLMCVFASYVCAFVVCIGIYSESSGKSFNDVVVKVLYGIFAEAFWIIVGAACGLFGLFIPVVIMETWDTSNFGGAISCLPMLTVPIGMFISGGVASFCLVSNIPYRERIYTMVATNVLYFSLLFFWVVSQYIASWTEQRAQEHEEPLLEL